MPVVTAEKVSRELLDRGEQTPMWGWRDLVIVKCKQRCRGFAGGM